MPQFKGNRFDKPDLPAVPRPLVYPTPEQVQARLGAHRAEALTKLQDTCAVALARETPPIHVPLPPHIHADDVAEVCDDLREIGWDVTCVGRALSIAFAGGRINRSGQ